MNMKAAVALLVLACAGCGAAPHSVNQTEPVQVPSTVARDAGSAVPVDAVLMEQACFAFSECRTTAHGLGV